MRPEPRTSRRRHCAGAVCRMTASAPHSLVQSPDVAVVRLVVELALLVLLGWWLWGVSVGAVLGSAAAQGLLPEAAGVLVRVLDEFQMGRGVGRQDFASAGQRRADVVPVVRRTNCAQHTRTDAAKKLD